VREESEIAINHSCVQPDERAKVGLGTPLVAPSGVERVPR